MTYQERFIKSANAGFVKRIIKSATPEAWAALQLSAHERLRIEVLDELGRARMLGPVRVLELATHPYGAIIAAHYRRTFGGKVYGYFTQEA